MAHDKYIIYTDGAARGNPGESASGFAVFSGKKLLALKVKYNGIATNNFAEYTAIIEALKWCSANIGSSCSIAIYSDSELVVKQLNGEYKVKSDNLIGLNAKAIALAEGFHEVKFKNVRRSNSGISMVDKALNDYLDNLAKRNSS